MAETILKIQQSLASSDNQKSCLLYNEDRSWQVTVTDNAGLSVLLDLLGERPKAYFKAKTDGKTFAIVEEVNEQAW